MGSQHIKLLIKATSSFLFALLLWEVILRNLVESSPGIREHPLLGNIRKSGRLLHTREGMARMQLNSLGMRHSEIQAKQPDEYRILVLGDSYTMATQIADRETFTALTESILMQTNLNSGRQIQVINAGKEGASPANYLYAGNFYNSKVQPDSVVVQLTPSDFSMQLSDPAEEFYLTTRSGQYRLVYNQSFGSSDPLASTLMGHFPQLEALRQLSVLRVGGRQAQHFFAATAQGIVPIARADDTQTQPKKNLALSPEEKALLDWTVQRFSQTFPNLVFVYIPAINYQDYISGRLADRTKLSENAVRNLLIEEYLEEKAAAYQIPMVNMRSDFVAFYRDRKTVLQGFNNTQPGLGHLNAAGHALVAEKLANFYTQAGL
ncbi:MAG: hypothetical protein AAF921_00160 [Cyanobacteria bacterium P01_D01_bin.44]